jgi:serine/threonine protein kinase
MLEFPVPDFGPEDDDVASWIGSCSSPCHPEPTTDADISLCMSHGLVLDQSAPLKCTANSTVYVAEGSDDGRRWAVKITTHTRRIEEEFRKRKQIPDSRYMLKSIGFHEGQRRALMQMELCEYGDIHGVRLEEPTIWELVHDIGSALAVIHTEGWMHLDVSPGNILISDSCFKLSDFGTLARIGQFQSGMEGAGPYVSPEALAFPHGPPVTEQTDIFSFGLVLLEVMAQMPAPRGGTKRYGAIRHGLVKAGQDPYRCSCTRTLVDLVNAMIDPDPDRRPTARQLVQIANHVMRL